MDSSPQSELPLELAWLPVLPDIPTLPVSWKQRVRLVHSRVWIGSAAGVVVAGGLLSVHQLWSGLAALGLLLAVAGILRHSYYAIQKAVEQIVLVDMPREFQRTKQKFQRHLDARTPIGDSFSQAIYRWAWDPPETFPEWPNLAQVRGGLCGSKAPPPWWHWKQPPLLARTEMVLQGHTRNYRYHEEVELAFAPMLTLMELARHVTRAVTDNYCLKFSIGEWLKIHRDKFRPVTWVAYSYLTLADQIARNYARAHPPREKTQTCTSAPPADRMQVWHDIQSISVEIALEWSALVDMKQALATLPAAAYSSMAAAIAQRTAQVASLERRAAQLRSEAGI